MISGCVNMALSCLSAAGRSGPHPQAHPPALCAGQRPAYPFAGARLGRTTHRRRPAGRPAGRQTRPALRASRVRSARRRQPVLSRIRSRWERTVRMLMYSWAAIWASVRPRATRVTSSCSRALSFPPGARGLRRAGGGEHEGVLGSGGQTHRRAAFLGRAGPGGPSACRASRRGSCRTRASSVAARVSLLPQSAANAAQTVTASA